MDGIDPERLGGPVDNIVLLNVLEHIEDDAALLARAARSLRPGGALIVFAPAFAHLYARMDREAGHFRRYSRRALVRLVEQPGLEVVHARYFNAIGFFGWWANKWLASGIHSRSTDVQIRLYDAAIPLLRGADRLLPFVGQSLIVAGVRRP
jgi:hypothetical protein